MLPDWLQSVQTARHLTGVQVAIWHRGQLITEVAVGPADEESGIALETTHKVRIASHSKMFCSLAVLALVEQGALRLDDQLGERVADLADSAVSDLTLRDLLSHSAGLTRDDTDASWWDLARPFPDRDELITIARERAVVVEPGVHLQYSNIGYGLLGLVVEEVTGQSFADAVTELVLDPVGVAGIGPDLPADAAGPEDPEGFALGHTGTVFGPRRIVEQVSTGALASATGFWATAGSIATFLGSVLCDGALLSERTRREMRRRVWTVSDGRHYGLGLQEGTFHGFSAIGHSGGFPTGLTRSWAVPSERLVVSVLGTAVDAPSSDLAVGILGLLSLASGRPAPQADGFEGEAALGGGGTGRPRPAVLADQDAVTIDGRDLSATEVADLVAGEYDTVWGRNRIAVLGARLFQLGGTALDPTEDAIELVVAGTDADPADPSLRTVRLATWGDSGYGNWAEPLRARLATAEDGTLTCTGIWDTGQLMVPSRDFVVPDRVRPGQAPVGQ